MAKRRATARPESRPRRKESLPELRERAGRILARLGRLYPGATTELRHSSAFELLIATILSAQSTDVTVNRVLPDLLARYAGARELAGAAIEDVERIVHSTGFFRQKARNIVLASRRIAEAYGGDVPDSMEALLTLPGVARKTANVVLGTWFRKEEGVIVDTHVGRLAHRLRLCGPSRGAKDSEAIERDLMQTIPRDRWTAFAHALTLHGRRVCTARSPACTACGLQEDCPSAFLTAS